MSSRAIPPAASPTCNASPTSRSFRYRSAQSKCRNPASSASLVAVIVTAASGIRVPKPSAGIWPPPLSGILVSRRSEDSVIVTPRTFRNRDTSVLLHDELHIQCDHDFVAHQPAGAPSMTQFHRVMGGKFANLTPMRSSPTTVSKRTKRHTGCPSMTQFHRGMGGIREPHPTAVIPSQAEGTCP